MRAIIINSRNRTVVEIDLVPTLDRLQKIVCGLIEPVDQGLDRQPAAFLPVRRRASAPRRQRHYPRLDRGRRRGAVPLIARMGQRARVGV
jgi:hypothetical protein